MGSVDSEIKCPNCNEEIYMDWYYKTGEHIIDCEHCKYYYSAFVINRNKAYEDLTDDDWQIIERGLKNKPNSSII